jgi:hypothetical protein
MNRKLLFVMFLSISTTFLFVAGLSAQTSKKGGTTLTGTVLGIDSKPIPHAAVSCESSGGLAPHAVHTDSKGRFVITGLKQDSYDLRASANGAYSDWHRNIPLRKGQSKDITLRLLVGTPPSSTTPLNQQDANPQQ